jgi:hypothetical protein
VAACGLPTSGIIDSAVAYTLSADCTQTDKLEARFVQRGTVTIDGNSFTVTVASGKRFLQSHNMDRSPSEGPQVILRNITLEGGGSSNGVLQFGERSQLENVTIRNYGFDSVGILAAGSTTIPGVRVTHTFQNVLIENGRGVYYTSASRGSGIISTGRADVTATNLVLRNLAGGNAALSTRKRRQDHAGRLLHG